MLMSNSDRLDMKGTARGAPDAEALARRLRSQFPCKMHDALPVCCNLRHSEPAGGCRRRKAVAALESAGAGPGGTWPRRVEAGAAAEVGSLGEMTLERRQPVAMLPGLGQQVARRGEALVAQHAVELVGMEPGRVHEVARAERTVGRGDVREGRLRRSRRDRQMKGQHEGPEIKVQARWPMEQLPAI